MIKKILVPTDGSENAFSAVKYAIDFIKDHGAPETEVTVIFVFTGTSSSVFHAHWVSDEAYQKAFEKEVELCTRETVETFEKAGINVNLLTPTGDPGTEIVMCANKQNFDLIIMGTRGVTGIKAWVPGSVAQKVICWAKCPVLTVH